MGRSPCCDKVGLKKGPWTPEEDQKLLAYIQAHGHGSWSALPSKAGLNRCGKSCRLRWTNYLRPDIKRGNFTLEEELTIIQLHSLLGNRWSAIASHLPERTDNEIKNYWNTHLKKRLAKMGIDPVTHMAKTNVILPSESQTKNAATLSHMAQWESARLEAEARLARQYKLRSTSFQHSLSSPESAKGSSPLKKPVTAPVPPPYPHMLKAWNNTAWTKPTNIGASVGTGDGALSFTILDNEIESPTSTLRYSEKATQVQSSRVRKSPMVFIGNSSGSCEGEMLKEETEEDWKSLVYATNLLEYKDEIENSISFASGFHDMTTTIESAWTTETLKTGDEDASSGNFAARFTDLLLNNSGNRNFIEGGVESDNGGSDSSEDRNNYWNSILNLMNSSPSDSPVF